MTLTCKLWGRKKTINNIIEKLNVHAGEAMSDGESYKT
jgi:NADH:ubiquinone oxidoreductase subunit E